MQVISTKLEKTGVRGLSAPLPSSQVGARVLDAAREAGMLARRVAYSMVSRYAGRVAQLSVTPSTEDGPLIVTHVLIKGLWQTNQRWQVEIATGTRKITAGKVNGAQLFCCQQGGQEPGEARGWVPLPAPIFVERAETLEFTVTAPEGETIAVGDGCIVSGYHLTDNEGGRLPPGPAERVVAELGREGQLFALSLQYDAGASNTQPGVNAGRDFLLQRVCLLTPEDGAALLSNLRLAVGNIDIFPQGLDGSALYSVQQDIQQSLVFDEIAWPIPAAARLVLTLQHLPTAGSTSSARTTLIGRAVRS